MQRTSQSPRRLLPWRTPGTMQLGKGGPIDWSKVSAYFFNVGKFTVKLNGAAAIGATSLTVDALAYALRKGTALDFGRYAGFTVTTGGAAAGATALPVTALAGPIPANTILDFTGAGEYARTTADAAAGATSLAVEALDATIENGDTATFAGGAQTVEVTADVAAGATAVPVEALQFAIADDTEALADATGSNDKRKIPAATVMARTSAGLLIPRRDGVSGSEIQAVGFLVSDADEQSATDAKSGYGLVIGNTSIYENLCPDADPTTGDLPAAYKTELAANSLGFVYEDWSDSRVV